MSNIKELVDREKPLFDYVGYNLRSSALAISIAYCIGNQLRPQAFMNIDSIFIWLAIIFALALFTITQAKIFYLTIDIAEIILPKKDDKSDYFVRTLAVRVAAILPFLFVMALSLELVEQWLEAGPVPREAMKCPTTESSSVPDS